MFFSMQRSTRLYGTLDYRTPTFDTIHFYLNIVKMVIKLTDDRVGVSNARGTEIRSVDCGKSRKNVPSYYVNITDNKRNGFIQ